MNKQPPDSHLEDDISLEEDFDAFYEEEMRQWDRDSGIYRLSHPLTLLFVLIPCLLVAVIAFVYMDVRKRLIQVEGTGSPKVGVLSHDVVERVTTLSQKFQALEKTFGERLSMLEDASVALEKKLQHQQSTNSLGNVKGDKARVAELADIEAALEANGARQQAAIEKLSKRLKKELEREVKAVKAFQRDLREQGEPFQKASTMIETLQKKVVKLELDMKLLSEEIVTKQALEKTEKRTADLERKADALVGELLRLENELKPR